MVLHYLRDLLARNRSGQFVVQPIATSLAIPVTAPTATWMPAGQPATRSRDLPAARFRPADVADWLIMQVDGTPGFPSRNVAGLGVVVRTHQGTVLRAHCERAPAQSSNEAEYQALIAGLRLIRREFPGRRARCLTDSKLVVDQLQGVAAARTDAIRALYQTARELIDQFPPTTLTLVHIPRSLNRLADALAWEALTGRHQLLKRIGTSFCL
ncbi:ribonuclease HI family protein [Chloroflexus sp.]|uniref:ribonuclease HI family protein n=1 Tax=Chloroflexus sp. TaxID=1904827 RepID=UPI0026192D76|nr:ribonuclease HI family protein [uncultured Chloroflexus sp.]